MSKGIVVNQENKTISCPPSAVTPSTVMEMCKIASQIEGIVSHGTVVSCWAALRQVTSVDGPLFRDQLCALLLGQRPSFGLQAMLSTGILDFFPELRCLVGVPHDPEWHPEGDVWVHNCMVVDSAKRVLDEDGVSAVSDRLLVMFGALCHDLGKGFVTEFVDGRWRSHKHDSIADAATASFLSRFGFDEDFISAVSATVVSHLMPFHFYKDKASLTSIRRLSSRVDLLALTRVARADFLGRTTPDAIACKDSREIPNCKWFSEQILAMQEIDSTPKPLVMGRDLIALGFAPGPDMGLLLKNAFHAQMDKSFFDKDGGIQWILNFICNHDKANASAT
jgi:tRNA nucleotidyltransferase (CCA-adding enzyme)